MNILQELFVCDYCKEKETYENLETAPPRPSNVMRVELDAPDTSSNTSRPWEVTFGFIGRSHMNASGVYGALPWMNLRS